MTTTTPKMKAPKPPTLSFVTPEMATEWLESNTENRNIRSAQVDALARDMTNGNWQITGDPVKFDTRGVLIDGQHRLWAIVQSGATVPLFVIRDLPTEVRDVIDTNVARSAGDVLRFGGGGKYANTLAAVARVAMIREAGGLKIATEWMRTKRYSNTEIVEYLEAHPEYEAVTPRSTVSYKAIGYNSASLWTYMLAQLQAVDADAAAEFETSLVELNTNGAGDPRATLIKWLRDQKESRLSNMAMAPRTLFATYRSWNAWRQGKPLSKIQISDGALIPEPV